MRLFPFFGTVRLFKFLSFSELFIAPKGPPSIFLIFCNRIYVQKIPKGPPFYIFRHYATYRRLQKKNWKKNSSSFLRAFVVSSCRKKVGFESYWALDMAPTWAVPGLLWVAVILAEGIIAAWDYNRTYMYLLSFLLTAFNCYIIVTKLKLLSHVVWPITIENSVLFWHKTIRL